MKHLLTAAILLCAVVGCGGDDGYTGYLVRNAVNHRIAVSIEFDSESQAQEWIDRETHDTACKNEIMLANMNGYSDASRDAVRGFKPEFRIWRYGNGVTK